MISNGFIPPKIRAVYEIMWKNIVERGRPHMTIWRMCIAWWVPKLKDRRGYCQLKEEALDRTMWRNRFGRFCNFADRASQYIYLNINQLDALNFIMSLFHASTCFEHMCSSSGCQNCTIQPLVSSHL